MAVQQQPRRQHGTGFRTLPRHTGRAASGNGAVATAAATGTTAGARMLAAVRICTGFVFLWAFLDKAFGLGYATQDKGAWVNGGSPTEGFLSHVSVGPMESVFHDWAGAAWADWLFMLGLLGVGIALISGTAMWPAALSGTVLMALMWAAEWPPAQHLSDGAPSMSSNPVVDYHLIYAIVLVALAAVHAGRTWGLGRIWEALPVVRGRRWLR